MPIDSVGDICDREPVETREEFEQRAREMAIRLENEQREAAILDEDKARYAEWTADFQAGHPHGMDFASEHGADVERDAA